MLAYFKEKFAGENDHFLLSSQIHVTTLTAVMAHASLNATKPHAPALLAML